jgi:hypothetical protein
MAGGWDGRLVLRNHLWKSQSAGSKPTGARRR